MDARMHVKGIKWLQGKPRPSHNTILQTIQEKIECCGEGGLNNALVYPDTKMSKWQVSESIAH